MSARRAPSGVGEDSRAPSGVGQNAPAPSGVGPQHDALAAAKLFAVDPAGLGGIRVRARPGPARETLVGLLRRLIDPAAPAVRLPPGATDDRIAGGVDLTATLSLGRPVAMKGLLAEAHGGVLFAPMAERLEPRVAAMVARALDSGEAAVAREGLEARHPARFGVVALDEGEGPDEACPRVLADRLAFFVDLTDAPGRGWPESDPSETAAARARLARVAPAPDAIVAALAAVAAAYAVEGLAAPLLALKAARAAAALAGREAIDEADAILAARLVLGPRARAAPADEPDEADDPPPDDPPPEAADAPPDGEGDEIRELDDRVIAAVAAALPEGVLDALRARAGRSPPARGRGTGSAKASRLRGRPVGERSGALANGARLALAATLRAAAPWQPARRRERESASRIDVRAEDFRIRRFADRREATIVFCVDASGSAAAQRLAEAKGAIEGLLAEAYSARTFVALVAFRGVASTILLPPTRSLARAKALLADLPGGGGTPLAAGLDQAFLVAAAERAKGRAVLTVALTDGRANVARDGAGGRAKAAQEALEAATRFASERLPAVLVDSGPRPSPEARALAEAMAARYVALPRLDPGRMRDAIRAEMAA